MPFDFSLMFSYNYIQLCIWSRNTREVMLCLYQCSSVRAPTGRGTKPGAASRDPRNNSADRMWHNGGKRKLPGSRGSNEVCPCRREDGLHPSAILVCPPRRITWPAITHRDCEWSHQWTWVWMLPPEAKSSFLAGGSYIPTSLKSVFGFWQTCSQVSPTTWSPFNPLFLNINRSQISDQLIQAEISSIKEKNWSKQRNRPWRNRVPLTWE